MTTATTNLPRIHKCAICKIDLKGRFVYIDDEFERILEYSKEELFGREFVEIVCEDDRVIIAEMLSRHNPYETSFESAGLRLFSRSGALVPIHIVASLNFVAGNPVNYQLMLVNSHHAIATDADSQGADERQPTAESRVTDSADIDDFSAVCSKLGIGTLTTDHDGAIVDRNEPAQPLLAGSREVKNLFDLASVLAEHNTPEIEQKLFDYFELLADDGNLPDLCVNCLLPDGSPAAILVRRNAAVHNDFSARFIFAPESATRRQTAQALTDPRMTRAIVSEVETSLVALADYAEHLAHTHYEKLGEEGNFNLLCVVGNVGRLRKIMARYAHVISLAQESDAATRTDIKLLLTQAIDENRQASPNITVTFEPAGAPKVPVPPRIMRSIIDPIVANCARFGNRDHTNVVVRLWEENQTAVVQISDDGRGMAPPIAERVFDFFFRGSREPESSPGTGLGLPLTRHLVEAFGGHIELTSEENVGTTVTISIPL